MKRTLNMAAAFLLAAAMLVPVSVQGVSAQKAIVYDAATGRVLYEKDANSRSLVASCTKIMTALVVCEQCNVLDRVRIPKEAVGIEGSSMYLREGEVLTVQELLYGLMLRSGNDAAVALAIYCGGTVEGFCQLMNDKAHRLGLKNTHFENPNGLDSPGHYSTAADLAVLTAYAMENPIFAKTVSTKTVTVGERCLTNHNKLLWRLEGAEGVKTGYTRAAGRILVSSASRSGRRLICVTINAPDDWNDHEKLLQTGFSEYRVKELIRKGQSLGTVDIAGGVGIAHLIAEEDFSYSVAGDEKLSVELPGAGFSYAPVVQGQKAGEAHICLNGKSVGKVSVVYGETVEKIADPKPNFFQRLLNAFS